MDIRQHAVEETSVLHIRGASDELLYEGVGAEKKPVEIVLFGPGSKVFVKADAARQQRAMDRFKRKGKMNALSATDALDEASTFLSAVTHEFRNLSYGDLQGVALFKAVYSDGSIGFVADQVHKHLSDWANFSKASPTS